jgi:hypothetical protein
MAIYRVTIKSTAWFWWPLAFLGGDLKRIRRPEVFHWKVLGSLWARTSIALTLLSVLAFAAANLAFDGAVFERNPLLTPVGYLMLVDWKLRIWQVCVLSAAGLSMLIVNMVNDVSGEYRIAQDTQDAELLKAATSKYGWIERLTRIRFLLLVGFWGLVGTRAVLYFNSQQCWVSLRTCDLWTCRPGRWSPTFGQLRRHQRSGPSLWMVGKTEHNSCRQPCCPKVTLLPKASHVPRYTQMIRG